MNYRTTIVAFFVFIAILAYVLMTLRQPGTLEQQMSQKRLITCKGSDIDFVELKTSTNSLIFEKSGQHWTITSPVPARASTAEMNNLLQALEFAEKERIHTENDLKAANEDFSNFGIYTPRMEASFRLPTGQTTFRFGQDTLMGNKIYVQQDSRNEVYEVSRQLYDKMNRPLESWRERSLIEFPSQPLTHLEIRSGNRIIELRETRDGWRLNRPIQARANRNKIEEVLLNFRDAQIVEFVTDAAGDLKAFGLDNPKVEIGFGFENEDQLKTLYIGDVKRDAPELIYVKLKNVNSVYTAKINLLNELLVPFNDFRDQNLVDLNPKDVKSISIINGPHQLQIDMLQPDFWSVTQPEVIRADNRQVQDLLQLLAHLKVKNFVNDAPSTLSEFGLEPPVYKVILYNQADTNSLNGQMTASSSTNDMPSVVHAGNSNIIAELHFGYERDDVVYVRRSEERYVYGISPAAWARLPKSFFQFRTRQLMRTDAELIQRLEFSGRKTPLIQLERNQENSWNLIAPENGILDNQAASMVAETLAKLEAQRIVGSSGEKLDMFGLDDPEMIITFRVGTEGEATNHTLSIGKTNEFGFHYARLSSNNLIFELSDSDFRQLNKSIVKAVPDSAASTQP